MESSGGEGLEKFRLFRRDDFDSDWVKVAERSFGRVYRVKLKLLRERCALKCLSTSSHYRYATHLHTHRYGLLQVPKDTGK